MFILIFACIFIRDFSLLPENDSWWYDTSKLEEKYDEWRPFGKYLVDGEPDDAFRQRMLDLKEYLLARPENNIALICHWGVIRALTGLEFDNCEVKMVEIDGTSSNEKSSTISLLAEPLV